MVSSMAQVTAGLPLHHRLLHGLCLFTHSDQFDSRLQHARTMARVTAGRVLLATNRLGSNMAGKFEHKLELGLVRESHMGGQGVAAWDTRPCTILCKEASAASWASLAMSAACTMTLFSFLDFLISSLMACIAGGLGGTVLAYIAGRGLGRGGKEVALHEMATLSGSG